MKEQQPYTLSTWPIPWSGRRSLAKRLGMFAIAVTLAGTLLLSMAQRAAAAPAPLVRLPDSVAPQVTGATFVAPADPAQRLTLGIALHSRNEAGLRDYASQVARPHSRLYHQYLSPTQFAAIFGADPAVLGNVQSYLQGQGLRIDAVASGGLYFIASGTIAQIQTAFQAPINRYRGADGQSFYANAVGLQVPQAIANAVITITGTENARQLHGTQAASTTSQPATQTPRTVTCPTTTYGSGAPYTVTGMLPAQINKAYGFTGSSSPGSGVWVAFAEFDGFALGDLAQYANCAGVSTAIQNNITASSYSTTPFVVTQNVSTSLTTAPGANFGTPLTPGVNAATVAEDLEVTLGLVPSIARLSVVQAMNTPQGMLNALATIANEDAAQVVGISWGMCEADLGFANALAEEHLFMQMALQGQSVFAAAGNNGLYACYGDGNGLRQYSFAVQDPASDPFVTAVGGTQLGVSTTSGSGIWAAEQPWNNYPSSGTTLPAIGAAAAGGGGVSLFWAAPSWQIAAQAAQIVPPANTSALTGVLAVNNLTNSLPARVVPDVSAAADPTNSSYAIYCSAGSAPCANGASSFVNVGGTAAADAVWVAAAVQGVQAANASSPPIGVRIGLVAPLLYAAYQADMVATSGNANLSAVVINSINYCDYANQLGFSTTSATAITPGAVTVTPGNMSGIVPGAAITLSGGTSSASETVTVTSVTATTFTATFGQTHTGSYNILPAPNVNTTASAIGAAGAQTVTPASMTNIAVGTPLFVYGANFAYTGEIVFPTATTSTTFTATFANNHTLLTSNIITPEFTFPIASQNLTATVAASVIVTTSAGIVTGDQLYIYGVGTAEWVTVTAVPDGTHINFTPANSHAGAYTLYGIGYNIASATGLTASTAASIVVSSTAGLVTGMSMTIINGASGTPEVVTVTIPDATHINFTPANTHTGTWNIIAPTINLTSATAISIPAPVTATVSSTAGLMAAQQFTVSGGGASSETITITAVTSPTTFTATFANLRAAGWTMAGRGRAAMGATLASFNQACATAANFILNASLPFSSSATTVTSSFPASGSFQQLPSTTTQLYGSAAGFAVKGAYSATYNSGYNALTGLGSPNVGAATAAGTNLAGYLAGAARVAIPRVYMVAQASANGTYWIGAYAFNPYAQNSPAFTQWYQLSATQVFSGAPVVVDDGVFGGLATNLYIIGPATTSTTGIAVIQWNIPTQTATLITTQRNGTTLPAGVCAGVTAFTNAKTNLAPTAIEVYCQNAAGNVYSTQITAFGNGTQTISNTVTLTAWGTTPIFTGVSSTPQIASDGSGNYLTLVQTANAVGTVWFQYYPAGFAGLSGTPTYNYAALAATCTTTPALAYVSQIGAFAAACVASDTRSMWANFFNTSSQKFNAFWTALGQPAASVTFMPGPAVAADNFATPTGSPPTYDAGYGSLVYIGQGSDRGMYVSTVNTANSNFLYSSGGWRGVSLPGIFSSGAAADFAGA